ncbi:50S ribosomal protein L24 [Buchnera aphidicola (Nipponaphis monzeni)]|uniref:Large ribosomal subunit protein uL24 n=1 Tax=Buchnera aphidicola (Nipponaphis monzeni) TaxID=2495405 RepID=A0A455TAQ7_9GAMM|nr:50S ribosomal protein L24 [Buchnera aphidicola]BBI01390.1 50S ribosomal protein L24 [Buchnera aphidicola (Nipponaphis monzeni)]
MARKIRKNDSVVVITGKYKGEIGIVQNVVSVDKIIVKNINVVKKHQKSIPDKNQPGGIITKELPIHVSNVKILNKKTNKPDRIKFNFLDGKKVRFYKSNNQVV